MLSRPVLSTTVEFPRTYFGRQAPDRDNEEVLERLMHVMYNTYSQ